MSYTRKQQCYQEGCHGKFGNGAIYQNENLRGRTNVNNRTNWLPVAIERCSKIKGCVGISYNTKCHSVYLHTKIDSARWRNENSPTFQGRPSNRHEWHTLILFNN